MSRSSPLEVCARCEMFKPSNEMTNVYARGTEGQVVCLRLCRACANPHLTYIAARWPTIKPLDAGRYLSASLALALVILNVIFGAVIGGSLGFGVALSGILVGAGMLTAVAVSCIQSS